MKREVNRPLKLKRSDIVWTLLPALLWVGSIYLRSSVITTTCAQAPERCGVTSLPEVDQLSYNMEDFRADDYSHTAQNLAGALALGIPTAWSLTQWAMGSLSPIGALANAGVNTVLVLQAASWNGAITEFTHLLVQRPRPFVYMDPAERGKDSAHYVSFYSGHTSFVATTSVAVLLILWWRGASLFWILLSLVSMESLVISTAYFRILAGRHFLTDGIVGAIAGTVIAWWVVARHGGWQWRGLAKGVFGHRLRKLST